MKRAWFIFRTTNYTWSNSLKLAWRQVKKESVQPKFIANVAKHTHEAVNVNAYARQLFAELKRKAA